MAPNLSEEEIDDLIYLARTGDDADLSESLGQIAQREGCTPADVLLAARDEAKATCLHMAAANGHSSESESIVRFRILVAVSPVHDWSIGHISRAKSHTDCPSQKPSP